MKTEYIKYPLIGLGLGAARGGLVVATPSLDSPKRKAQNPGALRTIGLNALVGGALGLGLARLATRSPKLTVTGSYKFFNLNRDNLKNKSQVRKAWTKLHAKYYQRAKQGDKISQDKLNEINKHFNNILTKDQPFFQKLGSALLPDAMKMIIQATKPFYMKGTKLPKIKPLSITKINKPMKLAETSPTAQAEIERLVKEWLERKPPKGVRKEVLAP